jgi:hypothetical protein
MQGCIDSDPVLTDYIEQLLDRSWGGPVATLCGSADAARPRTSSTSLPDIKGGRFAGARQTRSPG